MYRQISGVVEGYIVIGGCWEVYKYNMDSKKLVDIYNTIMLYQYIFLVYLSLIKYVWTVSR